jgi:hypothetical protein
MLLYSTYDIERKDLTSRWTTWERSSSTTGRALTVKLEAVLGPTSLVQTKVQAK